MRSAIVSIFLISSFLLQSLNAFFRPSSIAVSQSSDFKHSFSNARVVQEVPTLDASAQRLAISKNKRIIMLDNGGVLKSSTNPSEAELEKIVRTLTKLTQDERNEVWIITARKLSSVTRLYSGIPGLHMAGEMGTHVDNFETEASVAFEHMSAQINNINNILRQIKPRGISLDKLRNAIVIHYEESSTENREDFLEKAKDVLKQPAFIDYRLIERPYWNKDFATISHKDCHKGTLVKFLLEKHQDTSDTLFLSIGDQAVDEQMFLAFQSAQAAHSQNDMHANHYLSVLVHDPQEETNAAQQEPWLTLASRKLKDTTQVLRFLDKLGTGQ